MCLFLPRTQLDPVLRSAELKKESAKLAGLGFPPVNSLFFGGPEVALFGAIFPHWLFAICEPGSKSALWNPAVFKVQPTDASEIWKTGFRIDQEDFERRLKGTGYKRGFEQGPDGSKEIESC
jgi:hypothetical protein